MARPYDQQTWLDGLARNRSSELQTLTQELIDLTGPPPIPSFQAGSAEQMLEHFTAIQTIALQADERWNQAMLKTVNMPTSPDQKHEREIAAAEANFWADVRDWAGSLR